MSCIWSSRNNNIVFFFSSLWIINCTACIYITSKTSFIKLNWSTFSSFLASFLFPISNSLLSIWILPFPATLSKAYMLYFKLCFPSRGHICLFIKQESIKNHILAEESTSSKTETFKMVAFFPQFILWYTLSSSNNFIFKSIVTANEISTDLKSTLNSASRSGLILVIIIFFRFSHQKLLNFYLKKC